MDKDQIGPASGEGGDWRASQQNTEAFAELEKARAKRREAATSGASGPRVESLQQEAAAQAERWGGTEQSTPDAERSDQPGDQEAA